MDSFAGMLVELFIMDEHIRNATLLVFEEFLDSLELIFDVPKLEQSVKVS